MRTPRPRVYFSRALSPEQERVWRQKTTPDSIIQSCNQHHTQWLRPVQPMKSFDELLAWDLPGRILEILKTIASQINPQMPEDQIVLAFL